MLTSFTLFRHITEATLNDAITAVINVYTQFPLRICRTL